MVDTAALPVLPLAVTGGPGEGKSTVVSYLAEIGLSVFSADEAVAALWRDTTFRERVARTLGLPLPVDKAVVRELVTTDSAARRQLNTLAHPLVLAKMATSGATVFEVPLLVESCLHSFFRRVWAVTCGHEEQTARLVARLGDESLARRLVSAQLPSAVKCAFADAVVRTNRPPETVKSAVQALARAHGFV